MRRILDYREKNTQVRMVEDLIDRKDTGDWDKARQQRSKGVEK